MAIDFEHQIYSFVRTMSWRIFLILFSLISSCENLQLHNQTLIHVENLNYFLGQSQPKNQSSSWKIRNEKQISYILSLRILEIQSDEEDSWSNELIFKSDKKQILVTNLNQRIYYIPPTFNFQIDFRVKSPQFPSNTLNIQKFFLEFIPGNFYQNSSEYFICQKSGLIIPKQWKCNCLSECLFDDFSDEENCPLCSLIKPQESLFCHSNESWCLPKSHQIDSKGIKMITEYLINFFVFRYLSFL